MWAHLKTNKKYKVKKFLIFNNKYEECWRVNFILNDFIVKLFNGKRASSQAKDNPVRKSSMAAFALPAIASSSSLPRRRPPPIYISTNPSHLDPLHLRDLFLDSNHSCFRFPNLSLDGRVEPVDPVRLRKALAHSFIVVSVFCRTRFLAGDDSDEISAYGFRDLFERSPPESDRKLVGFGRAVSDGGLTASIHDVVVRKSW